MHLQFLLHHLLKQGKRNRSIERCTHTTGTKVPGKKLSCWHMHATWKHSLFWYYLYIPINKFIRLYLPYSSIQHLPYLYRSRSFLLRQHVTWPTHRFNTTLIYFSAQSMFWGQIRRTSPWIKLSRSVVSSGYVLRSKQWKVIYYARCPTTSWPSRCLLILGSKTTPWPVVRLNMHKHIGKRQIGENQCHCMFRKIAVH